MTEQDDTDKLINEWLDEWSEWCNQMTEKWGETCPLQVALQKQSFSSWVSVHKNVVILEHKRK